MNTIQHNNTIQFPQKILKFYQIVLCYCVVLCCWFFSFFLICSKNNTIQYNSITKYNFCIKTLNFYKIVLCYCVVLCCCIFSDFFFNCSKTNTIQYNKKVQFLHNNLKFYCVIVLLVFSFF